MSRLRPNRQNNQASEIEICQVVACRATAYVVFRILFCILFFAATQEKVYAIEFFWPSGSALAPCGNTLQNCINQTVSGRGDIVTIVDSFDVGGPDGLTYIAESVLINRDMTLRAAPFVQAIFVTTNSVSVQLQNGQQATVRDLTFVEGGVNFLHTEFDTGFATYIAERLRVLNFTGSAFSPCAIRAVSNQPSPGMVGVFGRFIIKDNVIRMTGANIESPPAICVRGNRFSGDAAPSEIVNNRIEATAASTGSVGIWVEMQSGAARVSGNRISGVQTPILAFQLLDGFAYDLILKNNVMSLNNGTGISAAINNGNVMIANNSIQCGASAVGGTGINGSNSFSATAQLRFFNNVISNCVLGINVSASATASNDHNLIYNSSEPIRGQIPGAGTLTDNPQFESLSYPKPLSGSPAIDAGTEDLALLGLDADGNQRVSGSTIDIGAFEMVPDRAFRETINLNAIAAPINQSNSILATTDHPIASPISGSFSNVQLEQFFALWFNGSSWLVRHAAVDEPLQVGRQFNVLTPRENAGHYRHINTSLNTLAGSSVTTLDHPDLNDQPNAIPIVTERFDRSVGNGLEAQPLNLFYSESSGRWNLSNDSNLAMVIGTEYDVMIGNRRSNLHFDVTTDLASPAVELRHIFLDDNPCAVFAIGRLDNSVSGVFNIEPFVAEFIPASATAPGRWKIAQPSGNNFPANAGFAVLIDGSATSRCSISPPVGPDPIFSNSFE